MSTPDQSEPKAAVVGAALTLERGRACYERRAWDEAFEALSLADEAAPLRAPDLELLSWTAALTGRDEELLKLLERLHQAFLDAGECVGAARAAFWLGLRLMAMREMGQASGWLGRAQRLVEQEGQDCAVRGYLLVPVSRRHMAGGEYEEAQKAAVAALEIGERFGDADLLAFARDLLGLILVRRGRIEEGLALLDEAMVAVTRGELSPMITGFVYCDTISCCQQIYAFDRAREWTRALAAWCQEQPQLVTFTGSCLLHRSEIMQLGGAWGEAMEEAQRAAERFGRAIDPGIAAEALYHQAEVHRLRGEFAAAEDAYRSASQLGREPQPGLALLRLVQGRVDAALAASRRVMAATTDRLQRTRFLPAHIEILLAAGEIEEAWTSCSELEQISHDFETEVLGAIAAHARGAIYLAEDDARTAVEPLRRAFRVWQQVGAPYIAARIRVLLARACRALGDEEATCLELDAAREVFERLGAGPDLALVEGLADSGEPEEPEAKHVGGLTARELQVLRLVASGKTNKAIGQELCLSERTVHRHVSNIFTKISVSSRAAATAYAYEHGLV